MKIQVSDLRTERRWRAATGLSEEQFVKLLLGFKEAYRTLYHQSVKERQAVSRKKCTLPSEEELLLFTLFSLKSGLTYDLIGVVCGMEASNVKRNQALGLKVLLRAWEIAGHAPKRQFLTVKEFETYFSEVKELILDGTEQRIQRPTDRVTQKDFYSGKKNPYDKIDGDQR
jgi:hypothetical protein